MAAKSRIRAMVVDGHPIMRKGIGDVLEASGRFEIAGQAGDGEEVVESARELKQDVIVMDVIMPRRDGIYACREIMELLPGRWVMVRTGRHRGRCGDIGGRHRSDGLPSEVLAGGGTGENGDGRSRGPAADSGPGDRKGLRHGSIEADALIQSTPGPVGGPEAGDADAVRRRQVQHGDSRSEGQQRRDRQEHHLPDTEKLGIETKQEPVIWILRNGLLNGKQGG